MDDKEAGKIICKGIINVEGAKDGLGLAVMGDDYAYFTVTIDVKDGKYRIVFTDFRHEGGNYGTRGNKIPNGGTLDADRPACGTMAISMNRWNRIKEDVAAESTKLN